MSNPAANFVPANKYALIELCNDPHELVPFEGIKATGNNPCFFGLVVKASECEVSEGYNDDGTVKNYKVKPGDVIYTANAGGSVFPLNLGKRYCLVHAGYIMGVIKEIDAKALGVKTLQGDGTMKAKGAAQKLVLAGAHQLPPAPLAV